MKTSEGKELRLISFFDEDPDARPEWPETCTQQTRAEKTCVTPYGRDACEAHQVSICRRASWST